MVMVVPHRTRIGMDIDSSIEEPSRSKATLPRSSFAVGKLLGDPTQGNIHAHKRISVSSEEIFFSSEEVTPF
jgi:hypothetical protein